MGLIDLEIVRTLSMAADEACRGEGARHWESFDGIDHWLGIRLSRKSEMGNVVFSRNTT